MTVLDFFASVGEGMVVGQFDADAMPDPEEMPADNVAGMVKVIVFTVTAWDLTEDGDTVVPLEWASVDALPVDVLRPLSAHLIAKAAYHRRGPAV